jgi:thiol:disulfide interchange protein DsbC
MPVLKKIVCGLFIFGVALNLLAAGVVRAATDSEVMEKFKKTFPWANAESLRKTDVEGMYEVVVPGRIIYYLPEKEYILVGSILTPSRKNLTEERMNEITTEKIKTLPLEKGLKIGNGKNIVIEFTDPDCPYCRDASKFLSGQGNITKYVFFIPLPMHPDAENKVKFVFCAKDKEKAYEEAMTGKLDGKKYEVCRDEKVEKLMGEHKQIAAKMSINSTPQFWINGKHVSGANIPLMQNLLGQDTKKPQNK